MVSSGRTHGCSLSVMRAANATNISSRATLSESFADTLWRINGTSQTVQKGPNRLRTSLKRSLITCSLMAKICWNKPSNRIQVLWNRANLEGLLIALV